MLALNVYISFKFSPLIKKLHTLILKVLKFLDARKLCCNLHKIQRRDQTLVYFIKKMLNGIANSEDPDQTAPLI